MVKFFSHFRKREWGFLLICLVFVVAQVWLDLKIPDFMKEITLIIQTPGKTVSDIWVAGGIMLLAALGSLASSIVVGFFAARIAASFSKRVRYKIFEKVESFSQAELNSFSIPSLITRSTNDITHLQQIITMGTQVVLKAPILATWAIIKISGKSWQWSTSTAVAIFVLLIMITIIVTIALPRFKKIQTLVDNLNKVTRENLNGLRVVRAYNAENYQESKFEKANAALTSNNLFVHRIMSIMHPGMSLIMSGLSLSIYWLGAYIINGAELMDKPGLFGDMIVFSSYAMQVVMAFMMLTMIFIMFPRASVSAKRVNEVLYSSSSITDGNRTHGNENIKGEIEFKNVCFKYPDASDYVLKDINFTAKKGEMVAFIGSTGSGKSTIVNLIPRFYDTTSGEILVNGVNIKDYKQSALRNIMGYVSQKAVIFSGTIKSNIDFGDNGRGKITDEDIKKALDIAQGSDFVAEREEGFDSHVAQGGTNLSGGQKQRLAIARAIARKPEFLIFDDSFSALDYKTDVKLRKALKSETDDITTIVVAQRIGTIKNADKIIVLEDGEIVGEGVHSELMKNCSVYQEIAYSQLSKEELA